MRSILWRKNGPRVQYSERCGVLFFYMLLEVVIPSLICGLDIVVCKSGERDMSLDVVVCNPVVCRLSSSSQS